MNSQSFNDFTLSVNTSVHQFLNHLITWRGTIAATLSTYIKITCGVWVVDSFIFFVVSPASKIVLYGRQRKWFCIRNIFLTKRFYPPRIKIGNAGNVYLKNAQYITTNRWNPDKNCSSENDIIQLLARGKRWNQSWGKCIFILNGISIFNWMLFQSFSANTNSTRWSSW